MNTQSKHTPGPWKIKKDRFSQSVWAGNERIAEMMGWGKNRRRANARIISAAPALLEALKSAVSYLEANRPKGNIREIFTQLNEYENGVLNPARAAIAQAEGRANA